MKVQGAIASVEPVEVGLAQKAVPQWQCQRGLGQQEEEVGEPGLLRPEGGDQSHGEVRGHSGHYPIDQAERLKCVHVEVIPRVAEGVFEDGLRVWDE